MKKILQVSRGNRPFLKGSRIRISPEFSKIILKFKSQFNVTFGIIIIIFSIFFYAQANHQTHVRIEYPTPPTHTDAYGEKTFSPKKMMELKMCGRPFIAEYEKSHLQDCGEGRSDS